MSQQELVRAAKDQAGGNSEKLAALIGWSKPTIDGWSAANAGREMPAPARIMLELLCEVPEARTWLLARKSRPAKKRAAK